VCVFCCQLQTLSDGTMMIWSGNGTHKDVSSQFAFPHVGVVAAWGAHLTDVFWRRLRIQ
jgi:hypothetical protein